MANPITSREVTYGGHENKTIHYYAAGPAIGPLIIFLHGFPATAISWKPTMETFAGLGFRVLAPDLPGSGTSTSRRVMDDYCQEALVEGMMALLRDERNEGGAIWVGHDWGAAVASSIATAHPETVKALINICVPLGTLECGWRALLPLVNRDMYPHDEYPNGQWDYHAYYEESFEKAVAWFESDIPGLVSAVASVPTPPIPGSGRKEKDHSSARKDGGLFGGVPYPPKIEETSSIPKMVEPDVLEAWIADMRRSGFYGGSAFYMHHGRNAAYLLGDPASPKSDKELQLDKPALFIHATHDLLCDTKTSRLMEPMRRRCSNLTEFTIDYSHWAPLARPAELQAGIFRFILDELPEEWPGYWDSGYTKKKK